MYFTLLGSGYRVILACWLLAIISPLVVAAEHRTFTSKAGSQIKAKILYVNNGKVHLERVGGKKLAVSKEGFSDADIQFIEKWAEKHKNIVPEHLKSRQPRIDMSVSNGKTRRKKNLHSGYVDEKRQLLDFTVKVINRDAIYPINNSIVTILVFGKSPKTGDDVVVYRHVFKNIRLSFLEAVLLDVPAFELWYDDYGAMYGFKYKGYCVYVKEPGGKFLSMKAIPGAVEKHIEAVDKLRQGDVIGKNYVATGSVSLEQSLKKK